MWVGNILFQGAVRSRSDMMARPLLVIGNKNYSSWSFRPWILLRYFGIEFEELKLSLDTDGFDQEVQKYSPSKRVPVWIDRDLRVWDSMAIMEHLAEENPSMWPKDDKARASCRSVSAEMHAGFSALRTHMPMNCRAKERNVTRTPALAEDIRRVLAIWKNCCRSFADDGPYLFGKFSIADAMYAPVVSRFLTYGVEMEKEARSYVESICALEAYQEWMSASAAEEEVIEREELGRAESQSV